MNDDNSQAIEIAVARADRRFRESLGYLQGHLSVLRRSGLDAEQRAALQAVEQSTSEIVLALEQLGDVVSGASSAQAQSFRFDLKRSLHWVHRQFQGRARANGISFEVVVGEQTPSSLIGDARRLRSILISLIDNAIRHTRTPAGVTLRVTPMDNSPGTEIALRFEVLDGGPGLSQELQQSLKNSAEGLDHEIAPSLAVVQQRLLSLGSRLVVQNTGTSGTHLTFDLRFQGGATPKDSSSRSSLQGRRVLIVDHSLANSRLLEKSLRHAGATCQCCSSLAESLAFLDTGELPDAIVLDGELADATDHTAAAALVEATQASEACVPLLLLASAAKRGDGSLFRDLGCRAYMVKPLQPEQILEALAAALARGPSQSFITTHSLEETAQLSANILLLADEPLVAHQVERLLSDAGHRHTRSAATNEGVTSLGAELKFDLILVDRAVKALDLLQVLDQRFPGVPRIVLVPPDEPTSSKLLAQGFDELLYKPIRSWELSQAVFRWSGRKLQRASNSTPEPESDPPIRLQVLDEATDGDKDLQAEMISVFCEDVASSFERIATALSEGQMKTVHTEAHSVKGSAPYFGADTLAALTQALELESDRGDVTRCRSVFEECQTEFKRIQNFFEH